MRLVTYLGLVARRIWAKRGMLLGSFVGATLVTALLVIVPLYEASVQAIDLLFTVRGAPADDVDYSAFVNTQDYSSGEARFNRDVVARGQERIAEWYPVIDERVQSRELFVIPTGGPVDWVAQGEQWKRQVAELIEAGADPETLPRAPFPQPPPEATTTRFLTSPDLEERVSVLSGTWPEPLDDLPPGGSAAPLPVALGSDLARLIDRDLGDVFILRPFTATPNVFELVEVAAVVQANDPEASFWGIDDPADMVYLPLETFDTWTGRIDVDAEADPWGRSARGFVSLDATQRWFLPFDATALDLEEIDTARSAVMAFRADLAREAGISASTFLPSLLDAFGVRSVVIGQPILAILALVVGGALYFLIYTAALTLEREGPEMALLRTRGASAWQTVGIHLAQSLVIAVLAAAAAPLVARGLVALTGRIPPLADLTGGEALEVSQIRSIVPFVLAGAAVTFVSMGLAVLPFARRSVLELRSLAARPGRTSVWQRYNLDLFAIGISLVVLFQLAQRGFINTSEEETRLDPLGVLFPVLLLFTGALVLLRLLPWLLKAVGWAMTKVRGMPMALPGWHLGRNPIPYGRLALLVWLTTGIGAFALTYANTLDTSFADRAAFAAGADVRIVGPGAGYLEVPEGDIGAAVLRTDGAPRQSSRRVEVLAVEPEAFAEVISWRSDFGAPTAEAALAPLRPDGAAPDLGIEIPADATMLELDGLVLSAPGAGPAPLRVVMRVFDDRHQVWTLAADADLVPTGWRTVRIPLDETAVLDNVLDPVMEPPLVIHSLWVERSSPSAGIVLDGDRFLLDDLVAVSPGGIVDLTPQLGELPTVNGLSVQEVDATAAADPARENPTLQREGTALEGAVAGQRTRVNPLVPQFRRVPDDLNVLLDREAAQNAGLDVGDTTSYSVAAQVFNGELVGLLGEVPTMTNRAREGNMIIDLAALNAWLNGGATWSFGTTVARVDAPGELWVATDNPDAAVRRLVAQMPENTADVITERGVTGEFSSRPVQVGLVAILFVGAATGVVLALAGVTGYVLLAVSRRAREMGVLRALGFQRSGVAATFAVEQVAVLGLGAIVGTIGGIALMWVMIPFLQLGETADEIVPPVVLDVDAPILLGYIGIVGLLLVGSVVWATRRVSIRRMSEVLREVER